MRLSLHSEKALEWIEAPEKKSGGIASVENCGIYGPAYPEVSGYLIPTLLKYDKYDLAMRLADWLISIQLPCGGFPDIHGEAAIFDTAMVINGLKALEEYGQKLKPCLTIGAIKTASDWARGRMANLSRHEGNLLNGYWLYSIKAHAAIGLTPEHVTDLGTGRIHYIAYALEGMQELGISTDHYLNMYTNAKKPFTYYMNKYKPVPEALGPCITGNIQMSILLKDKELLESMAQLQADNGGFPSREGKHKQHISWAAKYFLDACKEYESWK